MRRVSNSLTLLKKIDSFSGEYEFLSNFYHFPFWYNGVYYQNSEAAYQAQKTLDENIRWEFQHLAPGAAKRKGRLLELREDWDELKVDIMYYIIKQKFSHKKMKELLLNTGDALLIEGNVWKDSFWGVYQGEGLNYLGKILMRVRAELKEEDENESDNPT